MIFLQLIIYRYFMLINIKNDILYLYEKISFSCGQFLCILQLKSQYEM